MGTPERKKKLRLLLRKKAAEELKKEQELKAKERRRVIDQRCGQSKSTSGLGEGELKRVCQEYYDRICAVESSKYDLEKEVEYKDYMIDELNIAVNDLRGKFIKPSLKKVSKYENKFAKLQKKAAEFNFRNQLKTEKKKKKRERVENQRKLLPNCLLCESAHQACLTWQLLDIVSHPLPLVPAVVCRFSMWIITTSFG